MTHFTISTCSWTRRGLRWSSWKASPQPRCHHIRSQQTALATWRRGSRAAQGPCRAALRPRLGTSPPSCWTWPRASAPWAPPPPMRRCRWRGRRRCRALSWSPRRRQRGCPAVAVPRAPSASSRRPPAPRRRRRSRWRCQAARRARSTWLVFRLSGQQATRCGRASPARSSTPRGARTAWPADSATCAALGRRKGGKRRRPHSGAR
mmetsp:Transcript_78761/g.241019  ORF Transcript_78761/g.241019 Transcript_78761/m.241019 type:complete len:206 (-) Transcript_78761:119-736(-)